GRVHRVCRSMGRRRWLWGPAAGGLVLWGRLYAGRRSRGRAPWGRLTPALAGVNPAPHTGGPGGGWACFVGPALRRPTELRSNAWGRLAPALAGVNPAPHTRGPGGGWACFVGPALRRPTELRSNAWGRLAPALAGVNPAPHTRGLGGSWACFVGPASRRPAELRSNAVGPAGAGLGRGKPGPTHKGPRLRGSPLSGAGVTPARAAGRSRPGAGAAPALAGVNPPPHTRDPGCGWACFVGPASRRPAELRSNALGPAGAGLGRDEPGPTQEAPAAGGLVLWGRLYAGRWSRGRAPW